MTPLDTLKQREDLQNTERVVRERYQQRLEQNTALWKPRYYTASQSLTADQVYMPVIDPKSRQNAGPSTVLCSVSGWVQNETEVEPPPSLPQHFEAL